MIQPTVSLRWAHHQWVGLDPQAKFSVFSIQQRQWVDLESVAAAPPTTSRPAFCGTQRKEIDANHTDSRRAIGPTSNPYTFSLPAVRLILMRGSSLNSFMRNKNRFEPLGVFPLSGCAVLRRWVSLWTKKRVENQLSPVRLPGAKGEPQIRPKTEWCQFKLRMGSVCCFFFANHQLEDHNIILRFLFHRKGRPQQWKTRIGL